VPRATASKGHAMPRFFHRITKPIAQSPGTLAYTGVQKVERPQIDVIDFDRQDITVLEDVELAACFGYRESPTVTWIDVVGLHDVELVRRLGERFGIHPLVLEDVLNANQRPKLEDFDDHLFLVCRMLRTERGQTAVSSEQLSIVVGPGYVISFQEQPGDVFEPVRQRLRRPQGRLRQRSADYLAYALLDAVIDQYFLLAEAFGEAIEDLEDQLERDEASAVLGDIHLLKRELVLLRRAAWPLREITMSLIRSDSSLLDASTVPFLRDAHDHTQQVVDAVDSFRDLLAGLHDLMMANASNRLNDVMKVLTIFASIFVPLTFVAGIYGMNFAHMPELGWRWSYPLFWVVIAGIAGGMLVYFRRKKWL
jgi:magnesium transporter